MASFVLFMSKGILENRGGAGGRTRGKEQEQRPRSGWEMGSHPQRQIWIQDSSAGSGAELLLLGLVSIRAAESSPAHPGSRVSLWKMGWEWKGLQLNQFVPHPGQGQGPALF